MLVPLVLQALAREVDHAVGLLLHSTLDLPGFVPQALSLVDPGSAAKRVAAWMAGGCAVWLLLAAVHRRTTGEAWRETLAAEAQRFSFLLLRPALTLLALASLAIRPAYPYGFTLPVALTQDWAIAQDVAVLAAFLAWRVPRVRLPAPGAPRSRSSRSWPTRCCRRPGRASGRPSRERAEDPAHGGGARPLVDARRRGRERAHGAAPDARRCTGTRSRRSARWAGRGCA